MTSQVRLAFVTSICAARVSSTSRARHSRVRARQATASLTPTLWCLLSGTEAAGSNGERRVVSRFVPSLSSRVQLRQHVREGAVCG